MIGLSLTLKGLTVFQQAHPDPPVVHFPLLNASIHWREILSGKLVAEFMLAQPKLNINLQQLRSEAASKVSLKERGWQQALDEMLVGGVAMLLENRSHQEVATKVDIKGSVSKPETSTLQIVTELIKNAFFKAILPSFEKMIPGTGKR